LKFDKQAAAAEVASDYQEAKIKADRDKQLADQDLIAPLDFKLSATEARQLEIRNQIEEKRLAIIDRSTEAQLAAQRVRIDQLKAMYELKKQQVDGLRVQAGVAGILQQLGNSTAPAASGVTPPLEVGQNVAAGAILAKLAQENHLKAQIRITETEAKDIALNQPASIDTHNGTIAGRVTRIDPAAVNGTVLVDVLYVGRPTTGQPHTTVTLFRLDPEGKTATRVQVKLGRASVNTIEIVDGLKVGDRVILSDMSSMDSHDRIRLN
jgi:multidrug resistance efflux pump